jgi:hypothetical protein
MANSLESSGSFGSEAGADPSLGRLRIGMIAAASVLAGGLVAAWWYRETLSKLRQAEVDAQNPHFGIPADNSTGG